jgi:hypothetical protein
MLVFFLRISDLCRTSHFLTSVVLLTKEVELRTSSPVPGHGRTIPTADIGRSASTPANFQPGPRERATPRPHKPNNLARNGSVPTVQTRLSALEKPATDKVAHPGLRCVAPNSSFVKTLSAQEIPTNCHFNNPVFLRVVKKSFSTSANPFLAMEGRATSTRSNGCARSF